MNTETRQLIDRPYLEVVDDLLTAAAGGVVNEPILFDLKVDLYPLAEPARAVRGVTGTAGGRRHAFLPGTDFEFSEGDNAVVWLGTTLPDDETVFFVDYFRPESRSPLTDLNAGSVTRTLMEAIGREIAIVYQQINRAYFAAFLDTAEGTSLDLVVSILGLERKTGEFASGLVTFFRDPAVAGNLAIPEGTRLVTTQGEVLFETTQPRTLQSGQVRIDAPIRAAEGFAGEAGRVEAGAITEMAQPLGGIARVSNVEATFLAAGDESDEELRLRARARLRALGKATLFALDRVIREGRGTPLEFRDPSAAPPRRSDPGTVSVFVEAEAERLPGLRAAVEETRAAGVLATLVGRFVFVRPRLVATLGQPLTAAGKDKVKDEMIAAFQVEIDRLTSGEAIDGATLLAALGTVREISGPQFRDVLTWRSDLAGGGDPSAALAGQLANKAADPAVSDLAAAFAELLADQQTAASAGVRIADRSLVQSSAEAESGQPAIDEEIETGAFQVSATVGGEPWSLVLDMSRADVVLEEGA